MKCLEKYPKDRCKLYYEKETFISGDLSTGILFNSDPVKYNDGIRSHNGGLEFVYDYSPDINFAYSYAGSSNTQIYKVKKFNCFKVMRNICSA